MQDAFTFIIAQVFDLYVITFFLRLALAWARADFRNPLAQFIVKVTNPLVIPARRFIPALGGFDLATPVVLVVLQSLATGILVQFACIGGNEVGPIVVLGLLRLMHLVLQTYTLLMLVYVISSWISQGGYNPAIAVVAAIVEPVLSPFRRVIPSIGGLDLSPIAGLLAIQFLNRLIPSGLQMTGLVCVPF